MKKIIMLIIFAVILLQTGKDQTEEEPSVLVKTETITQQSLSVKITSYGRVSFDPRQVVNVSFPRAGQVDRLSIVSGQHVKKGDAMFGFKTDPAESLNYEKASADAAYTQQELGRIEEMVKNRLATQSQLAQARKALADAEASLAMQRKLGTDKEYEASVAPFAGVITAVNVAPGDRIAAGAPILQLVPANALIAILGIEPEDSFRLKEGLQLRVTPVFDRSHSIEGTIRDIHSVVNQQTRRVDVVVGLEGEQTTFFLPAMPVIGEISLEQEKSWVVPRSAVLHNERGSYIYQVKDGHAKQVFVRTGIEEAAVIGISGSFDPELKVVTEGNYELQDGMAIREENK